MSLTVNIQCYPCAIVVLELCAVVVSIDVILCDVCVEDIDVGDQLAVNNQQDITVRNGLVDVLITCVGLVAVFVNNMENCLAVQNEVGSCLVIKAAYRLECLLIVSFERNSCAADSLVSL